MREASIALVLVYFLLGHFWGLYKSYRHSRFAKENFPQESKHQRTFYSHHPWLYRRIKNPDLRKLHRNYNIEGAVLLAFAPVILWLAGLM